MLNIEEVINILPKIELAAKYETTEYKLFTKDRRIIYGTEEYEFLEKSAPKYLQCFQDFEGKHHYHIAPGDTADEGKKLVAYAFSKGYKDFKGLGWILVIVHETECTIVDALVVTVGAAHGRDSS